MNNCDRDFFRFWCYKVLPLVYDDSLSYYEILCKMVTYINNLIETDKLQNDEIDKLKKDLVDIKYDALTRSSELMEKSRQSRIEEYISTEESHLQTATNRPYLIKKD